jgi:hypothetical protein
MPILFGMGFFVFMVERNHVPLTYLGPVGGVSCESELPRKMLQLSHKDADGDAWE